MKYKLINFKYPLGFDLICILMHLKNPLMEWNQFPYPLYVADDRFNPMLMNIRMKNLRKFNSFIHFPFFVYFQGGHLPQTIDFIEPEADHRMRHQRFLRQEIHDVEVTQNAMKRQLSELINHRMADRIRSLEVEQRRMANYNFNMSRQISNLDKMHVSMLELLEAVQEIQTKVDKIIPDFNNEISKLEFNTAQMTSDQNLLREESQNSAKSIQAMAVSVSTLQGEREQLKIYTESIKGLQKDVEQLKSSPYWNNDIVRKHIAEVNIVLLFSWHIPYSHHKAIFGIYIKFFVINSFHLYSMYDLITIRVGVRQPQPGNTLFLWSNLLTSGYVILSPWWLAQILFTLLAIYPNCDRPYIRFDYISVDCKDYLIWLLLKNIFIVIFHIWFLIFYLFIYTSF